MNKSAYIKYYTLLLLLAGLSGWSKLQAIDSDSPALTRAVSGEYSTLPFAVSGGVELADAPPPPPVLRRSGRVGAYRHDFDPNAIGDSELMRVIRNGPQADGNQLPEAAALIRDIEILVLESDPRAQNNAGDTALSLLAQKDWPLEVKAELLQILNHRLAALEAGVGEAYEDASSTSGMSSSE